MLQRQRLSYKTIRLHYLMCIFVFVCTFLDIDECKLHNGGCSHTCSNSPGGHVCHCPSPLLLDADNLTCSSMFLMTVVTSHHLIFF